MPSWISEENLQKALNNGINYHTLYSRIKNGWTIKEATTIPVHEGAITKEEKEIAESNGISYYTVYSRINESGMSIEEAIIAPLGVCKERKHGKWTKMALENGILETTFYSRLKLGWGYEEAATKPVRKMNTMNEWLEIAKSNGIKRNTFYTRIYHQKLDLETAATRPVSHLGRRCSMKGKEEVS